MDETAVRQELVHNMEEWGLTTTSDDKRHRTYRHHILKQGVAQFCKENSSSTFDHLRDEVFPDAYSDAIRFFFRRELQESKNRLTVLVDDKLEHLDDFRSKPYYRRYDRRDRSKVVSYVVKDIFKQVTKSHLDPFGRFTFAFGPQSNMKRMIRLFEDWFLCEEAAAEGKVLEAVLASHAIYKEACFQCKRRNTLRWNGGADTSWMDLVCIACHSTYEVKTKADMEKCETHLERYSIRGGSYENYWRHRNTIQGNENQKMFVAILPRQWTVNRSNKSIRPVSCYEIDHVLPVVTASCFRPIKPPTGITKEQKERYVILPLKSMAKLKAAPIEKAHWFSLEKWEPPIDYGSIMEEVFIEHYTKKEYDNLASAYDRLCETLESENPEPEVEPENTVERLKAELENMKIGCDADDDWETMF